MAESGALPHQSYLRLTGQQAAAFFRTLHMTTCQVVADESLVWWFSPPGLRLVLVDGEADHERPFRLYVQEPRHG